MASLSPGVLLRLIEDKDSSPSPGGASPRRPLLHSPLAVLQITGIVPAVDDPNLCPDKGFYVKLSDASHSTFVSLPADLNDLILADRLQIGQFIHVRRLEPASPIPVLRDFRLLTGRHPCHHGTVNLVSPPVPTTVAANTTPGPGGAAFRPAGTPPLPPPAKKKRQLHPRRYSIVVGDRSSEAAMSSPSSLTAASPLHRAVKKREHKGRSPDVQSDLKNLSFVSIEEEIYDSDDDDSRLSFTSSSSSSPYTSRSRRSWDSSPGRNATENRKEMKPMTPHHIATVSPIRFSQHISLLPKDDASCRRSTEKTLKLLESPAKRKLSDSEKTCSEISSISSAFSSPDNTRSPDKVGLIWALLPPNLMKHGKEVIRQRDSSLQAAIDSLLEASAAEKFIECLSMYAELQSEKDEDPQDVVNRFLNFHQKMAHTRVIAQSLLKSTQQSSCNWSLPCPASTRSVAKVASERKSYATLWIKAAMESDLSQFPAQLKTDFEASEALPSNNSNMPCSITSKTKNVLPKGSSILMAANALQYEYNRWFLRYIDKFLDTLQSEDGDSACELEVANLLCQLKRVDDWLNNITRKDLNWPRDRIRDNMLSEDEEIEACERVRRKIYSILLRHVESAAIALESMSTPDHKEDRELMLTS
ncbi:hypothetical protein Cni_G25738 [Canna indica]|uniref:Uncharacterized protein n=1 Tax=Canna indica TaxID=4628 RepID=A0AAQ3QQQ2_9LILI|nr:hypothetical protein Cni_G25738 [Canna indica]